MERKPCAVVASCTSTHPHEIIKCNNPSFLHAYQYFYVVKLKCILSTSMAISFISVILGVDELPEPTKFEEGIIAYPWHVDTKYYTADVNLCSIEKKTLGSEQFAKSVEAVVIHFDSNKVYMNNRCLTGVEFSKCNFETPEL